MRASKGLCKDIVSINDAGHNKKDECEVRERN